MDGFQNNFIQLLILLSTRVGGKKMEKKNPGQTKKAVMFGFTIKNHQDSPYIVVFWGLRLK